MCNGPLAKPPLWENGKKQESEATDGRENYPLGAIISAPIPGAEAFCRSCLNSIEERNANGDGW